jgi:hypothetical protein
MEMLLFLFLVPGRLPWRNDWSQHWKSVVLISYYCIFILALIPDRSQVIALRRSYCYDCSLFIIVLSIRVLFLSVVFPCFSCSGQVIGDSSKRKL